MASGTLLTEQDRRAFRIKYGGLIRQQCVSLMGDTPAARELEERVIRSIEDKYEYQPLPEHCEMMLIARCCILSSRMEAPWAEEKPGAGAEAPAVSEAEEAAKPEEHLEAPADEAPAEASPEVPQEVPKEVPAEAPREDLEDIPEELRSIRITAVYDPEKTMLWLPDGLKPDKVREQIDPEDPEEDTEERNVFHSILNTFLVIVFLASIGFFLWRTGILRWLNRYLEGLLIYG